MFKSWFGRKSPDQQAPRQTAKGSSNLPKHPDGPRFPFGYNGPSLIFTSEVEHVASVELENAIRRRVPEISFDGAPAGSLEIGHRPTALGAYPETMKAVQSGRMPILCGLTYDPSINLDGLDQQSYVTSSWWWPETREVVARTKAHAFTVVLGDFEKTPVKERILIELQMVAAALDVLKSVTAVVWRDANAMWKPEMFLSELRQANGDIPVRLIVAVKLGLDTENLRPDGQPKLFARTEGLHAFGLMEVEWRAFDGEFPDLANWMQGIAWYLVNKGPIIRDGESMGSDAPGVMPSVVIRHESSTTVLGKCAYVVYPQQIN